MTLGQAQKNHSSLVLYEEKHPAQTLTHQGKLMLKDIAAPVTHNSNILRSISHSADGQTVCDHV